MLHAQNPELRTQNSELRKVQKQVQRQNSICNRMAEWALQIVSMQMGVLATNKAMLELDQSESETAAPQASPGVAKHLCRTLPRILNTAGACGCMPFFTKRPCLLVSRATASSAMLRSKSNAVSVVACAFKCKICYTIGSMG